MQLRVPIILRYLIIKKNKFLVKSKKRMNNQDIKMLIKILEFKERKDRADLFEGTVGRIQESTQYGNYLFSVLSTFVVFAPLEKYYKLKGLSKEEEKLILDSILEIHPPEAYSPEITSVEFRILQESNDSEKIEVADIVETIRVFLSYSTSDKTLAGKIKSWLEYYGLKVFLAHEDIIPSAEWQKIILQNLENCHVFIPIITKDFKASGWTDQEIGIALAKKKFIIPLSIDIISYGFLNKLQSLKLDSKRVQLSCKEIIKILKNNSKFEKSLSDSLIKAFLNSKNFEEAKNKSRLLLEFDDMLTAEQINKIIEGSIQNDQIYYSFGAQNVLRELTQRHNKVINEDLIEKLHEKID